MYPAAVLIAAGGAVSDLRYRKIYNKLTLPSMGAGIILNLVFRGVPGLGNSLLGILLGFSCFVFWMIGMLKAGDIKLYMALGAFGGWKFCACTVIASVLAGGAAACILMLTRKTGRAALRRLKLYMTNMIYTRQFRTYQPEGEDSYFSFGCCILAGALISTWYLTAA